MRLKRAPCCAFMFVSTVHPFRHLQTLFSLKCSCANSHRHADPERKWAGRPPCRRQQGSGDSNLGLLAESAKLHLNVRAAKPADAQYLISPLHKWYLSFCLVGCHTLLGNQHCAFFVASLLLEVLAAKVTMLPKSVRAFQRGRCTCRCKSVKALKLVLLPVA